MRIVISAVVLVLIGLEMGRLTPIERLAERWAETEPTRIAQDER